MALSHCHGESGVLQHQLLVQAQQLRDVLDAQGWSTGEQEGMPLLHAGDCILLLHEKADTLCLQLCYAWQRRPCIILGMGSNAQQLASRVVWQLQEALVQSNAMQTTTYETCETAQYCCMSLPV